MAEIVTESVTTQNQGPKKAVTVETKNVASKSQTIEYLIYFIFGALEILLTFRFILKLAGASHSSTFVSFIYSLTGLFILPFKGIFRQAIVQGTEITAVFEPSTMVALAVYAVLAWGIVQLLRIFSGEKQT